MIEDRWAPSGALGEGTPGDALTFYLPEPLARPPVRPAGLRLCGLTAPSGEAPSLPAAP